MKKNSSFLITFILITDLFSRNPIVPPGIYIADPSAHVWKDGKLYIYGSRDESPDYYCSWNYHVLSTSDLKTWTIHENIFASKGPDDQVPYSDNYLYAPDVQYKNGTYYLYYCLASNKQTEGVATSSLPTGPFINGTVIETGGINQIDPTGINGGDKAAYKYLDFGSGVKSVTFRVLPGYDAGSIRLTLGNSFSSAGGATVEIPGNGDGKTWTTISASVSNTTGVNAVWLRFNTKGENSFKVDWFKFE